MRYLIPDIAYQALSQFRASRSGRVGRSLQALCQYRASRREIPEHHYQRHPPVVKSRHQPAVTWPLKRRDVTSLRAVTLSHREAR
eukprot:104322-Rhodomonas_salina.2